MKYCTLALVALGMALSANAAYAGQRGPADDTDYVFGFIPVHHSQSNDYCYGADESCKAPHLGFDPHGNGVNPPIGAQTDQ
jgi:hypothetical protein